MPTTRLQTLSSRLPIEWRIYILSIIGLGLSIGLDNHSTPFVLLLLLLAAPHAKTFFSEISSNKPIRPLLLGSALFFLAPTAHEAIVGLDHFAATAVKPLLCMLLIMPLYYRATQPERLLAHIIIAGAVTVGLIAGYDRLVLGESRISGGHNPIMLSIISTTLWFAAIIHINAVTDKRLKLILLLAAFCSVPAITLSGTRIAWLYVLLFSPLAFAWIWKTAGAQMRRWLFISAICIGPLIGIVALNDSYTYTKVSDAYAQASQLLKADSVEDKVFSKSLGVRVALAKGSIDVIQKAPLGIGVEGFYAHMSELAANGEANSVYLEKQYKPHNQLLLMGVMFGWLGIFCLLGFWAAMILVPLKIALDCSARPRHFYLLASFVATGLVAFSQTDIPMSHNMPFVWVCWFYFALLGMGQAASTIDTQGRAALDSSDR